MLEFVFGVLKELRNRKLFWLAIVIIGLLALEPVMAWRSAFIAQSRLQREQALSDLAELRGWPRVGNQKGRWWCRDAGRSFVLGSKQEIS